ncbi:SMI1/KNR4 family protein [Amycolatopsis sp. BJA-103]|uniref:SMI1/KNR4 family protein n=1 Tax=Amycolatopsis sp. BJA-103 TaxID=1911175 RepID=UPI000C78D27D|nr:SMI1/KNR4 family protein [Amycolatopsis sp. BJA-103]AUI60423.1 hypothetical protein BKN51_20985 [Amycolatopsis sp. BJA-103]PNE16448.1 hypothetical protein B1H26_24625 [Amycolatopsis sp. BJA-103]
MSKSSARELVERLAQISGWRGEIETARDWEFVERELGTSLPDDYKQLLSRFPSGSYRNAIWVRNPIDARVDLSDYIENDVRSVIDVIGDEEMTYLDDADYRLFPEREGLLPWGDDLQGGMFCWVTGRSEPDHWPVAYYNQDLDKWKETSKPMVEIILEVLVNNGENNILGWNLDHEPAVFRVPSVHLGNGIWKPNPGYE